VIPGVLPGLTGSTPPEKLIGQESPDTVAITGIEIVDWGVLLISLEPLT